MRLVVQRVSRAEVRVQSAVVGSIGRGFLILAGFRQNEDDGNLEWLARKTAGLRLFEDAEGKMNLSLAEVGGSALVVSQFTLYADTRKGKRPSFVEAAPPEEAEPMYERFCSLLQAEGIAVQRGVFGARMEVELVNDGPVTIILER